MAPPPAVSPRETSPRRLHSIIKHQEHYIAQQKQKIKALQSQNRRFQNKIEEIEKSLEPVQKKVDALHEINVKAHALIKRQFIKQIRGDQEEKHNPDA